MPYPRDPQPPVAQVVLLIVGCVAVIVIGFILLALLLSKYL